MFQKKKEKGLIKKQVLNERRKLIEGTRLAMLQWQYGLVGEENHHDTLADLLERRYMFLYETAKQRKIHALE